MESRVLGTFLEMGAASSLESHQALRTQLVTCPFQMEMVLFQPPNAQWGSPSHTHKDFTLITAQPLCLEASRIPTCMWEGQLTKQRVHCFLGLLLNFSLLYCFIVLVERGTLRLQILLNNIKLLKKKEPHKHSLASEY